MVDYQTSTLRIVLLAIASIFVFILIASTLFEYKHVVDKTDFVIGDAYIIKHCSVCGKEVTSSTGRDFYARKIGVSDKCLLADTKFASEQFGAYNPNKTYYVCVECWLRSLGVKAEGDNARITIEDIMRGGNTKNENKAEEQRKGQ